MGNCDKIELQNMRKLTTNLFLIVLLLLSTASWAQTALVAGKIYHFQNANFTGRAITAVEGTETSVRAAATDTADLKQQWLVSMDGDSYIFRNMYNGYYLSQMGQKAWGLTETCADNSNKFEYIVAGGTNNTIRSVSVSTNSNAYMHLGTATQTAIEGWSSSAGGTQWTVTNIKYTDGHDAILGQFAGAALGEIFSDEACCDLKDTYANMTNEQLYADANYLALPTALRKLVKKVRSGDWTEATIAPADRPNGNNNTNHNLWTVEDTWSSDYAKRFRVQMYEPYSIEGEVTSYLRLNAHCNMDNPTGIYANSGETIYIMVGDDIPEGAELWLAHQVGNGATNYYNNSAYTQLHKGLNRVTFTSDGCQMWINYVVHTYNEDGATIAEKFPENRKLSNYKPLKIHIEGGHINGFFNAMGDYRAADSETENLWGDVDNDDDWNYYKARVALPTDFALLGHRQTLLFPFGAYDSEKGCFGVANADGGIEKALAYHLENIEVVSTPNCYSGNGKGFGNYGDTYYPGMGLSTTNGKINIMLEAWDRIMYSELATMGLVSKSTMDKMNELYPRWTSEGTAAEIYNYGEATVNGETKTYKEFCQGLDYSEYFNHHGSGVGAGSGYMSGGWRVCNYHYNTMGSIIGKIANEAGPTWGPAHEIGHQHQAVFNLNGQTEVTNNFFSNVAVWYMGMITSRVNGNEGSLESVLAAFNTENNDLYSNNIWAITHLYYRLWLYYHLAGNNTQFWPRLFELCRREPLINGGQISGETSLLRFYQHACNAAGEDLTEFFRAHGFFEIMDNRLVGDYSNATYNITQEQIDAAIKEVKDKGYPQNLAVLFINDGTSETTLRHDGSTKRSLWDNNPTAEFGSVNDFIDGDVDITTAYTATLDNNGNVIMSGGKGGVGFLVLNEKGEIISFSNKSTFKLSDEALETIVSGKATFVTVDTENNVTNAEVDITALQKSVLESLILKAQQIVDKIDDTYTRIGYFKGAAVADLANALDYANEICAGSSGFEAAYDLLYAEYRKVLQNGDCKISFNPSLTYVITNYAYPAQTMWVNGEKTVRSEGGVNQTSNDAKWKFVETSASGIYNIRTLNNDYIPAVQQSASMTATAGQPDNDALYTLEEVKDGVWAIKLSPSADYRNLHSSGNNVVGWKTDADASRWYITAVEADPLIADLTDLEVYINKTELLLDEVLGSVTYTKGEALPLQTGTKGSANYLWSNAPSTQEGNIDYLVDGITGVESNYFHTEFSTEPTSGTHYLAVYLGENNTLSRFTFSHTTRFGAANDYPKGVDVYGSNDNVTYKYIGSAANMPQEKGVTWEFDGVMLSSYKYLRFNYHANRGYWHMAEFEIMPVIGFTPTVNDAYSETVGADAVTAAMDALLDGKRIVGSFSPVAADIEAKLHALQTAYNVLYTQYKQTIDVRKATLAALVADTEKLISGVGDVVFAQENKLELTNKNLYCNSVDSDGGATKDNRYNLADGYESTYLHTSPNGKGEDNYDYHYLRVDLGEGNNAKNFKFNYQNRTPSSFLVFPKELIIQGSNDNSKYDDIVEISSGLPNTVGGTYVTPTALGSDNAYRYFRFVVKSTYANRGTPNYFCMAEFGFSTLTEEKVTIKDAYKSLVDNDLLLKTVHVTNSSKAISENDLITSVPMLDAQIAEMQEAKAKLENLIAQVGIDKEELQALYNDVLELYGKMADDEGNVKADYEPSALTNEKLSEVKAVMDSAKDKLDNSTVQAEIDDALVALQASYNALHAVENANVAATLDKSGMNTAIDNAEELIAEINDNFDYYAPVDGLGLAELGYALQNAQAIVARYYLTQTQYDDALSVLNACLSATQTVVNADCADRTALETAIKNAEALLETIEAKGEGYYSAVAGLGVDDLKEALQNAQDMFGAYHTAEQCAPVLEQLNSCYATTNGIVALDSDSENRNNLAAVITDVRTLLSEIAFEADSTVALPLQVTDANAPFYIRMSAVGDCNIANIIDKNDDGSANIGTYVGSAWGGTIADYTHYVQIDLGNAIAIDELLFSYATRDSGHATERPTAIKVLGSNDGVDYTEITVIDEGLATGAGERWAMETPLALGGSYRYIRFAVKSEVNSFHMSDFSLYTALSHTLNKYYTTADMVAFDKLCLVLQSAEYVATHYTVSEECEIVYEALSNCYAAVQAVVDADYSNREELQSLIAETEALIARIANVADVETPVWSAANVYCNADNSTNASAGAGDKRGVEALFDGNTGTHLHTTYGGNAQDDDLDHYIRIDMGEGNAVKAFKFNYIGRSNNSGNDPEIIVVQACNTIDGEWVNVKTLTDLPTQGDAVKYASPLIDMEEAYRYVRLMVTDTENNSTTTYNGIAHKFFVLSEFGFTAYPTVDIAEEYAYNMYSEPVIDAYIEKNTAIEENEYYMTEDKYNDAVASLQAAKAAIENALLLNEIPVKLTRDVEKPILYKIRIKRSETSVLQYDEATGMVAVVDDELNRNQAWYFMSGTNDEVFDDILIMPYSNNGAQNTTLKLGSNDLNDGKSKVKGVDGSDDSYKINWYITFKTNVVTDEAGNETITDVTKTGFWNIQPEGKGTYFSNHGGVSNKMGFWSSNNSPSDDGSNFQFILDETDYSLSDAYFALYNEHADCGGLKVGGVNVGQYSVTSVEQYNNAYNDAATLLENKTADDSEYNAAREALSSAYSSLERKMPNEKGLYRIKSANTIAYSNGKFAYVNSDNKPHFANPENECLAEYIWQFEVNDNGYYIKSLQTQCYLDTAKWATQINLSARPLKYTVEILDEATGELKLNSTGGYPLHAQDSGSKLVGYTGGLGSASAWYIEELTEEEVKSIHYPYTMSKLGYGTLMLGFNAVIPEEITASYAAGLDGVSINMVEIKDILPANTPVILKSKEELAEDLPLEFVYTTETADAIENNMLEGTLYKRVVEAGDARDIYMMQAKNDAVKMYWMYENYNASGERIPDRNGSYNHDDGGYVMNSANRAYLVINREVAQQVANYSFHFTTEGAMDIEDVECEREIVESIYDLQGRKLEGITQPGFYIVNGKKVYVK